MKHSYSLLCLLLLTACLAVPSVARGGRGRGGGSFGGLFGGWRSKYGSKSSSSGGGRRVVSGVPMQSSMTVPKLPPPPPPPPKPMSMPKPQVASYPRQQLPPGYGYPAASGQGTYFANAQALPAGAIYYAQPPMGMSMGSSMGSGTNGFLTGMLAGRLMDGMIFGNRHHVSHVYHQNQQGEPSAAGTGREIIIINNGQPQGEGEAQQALNESQVPEGLSTVPLENPLSKEEEEQEAGPSEETGDGTTLPPAPPVGGILCFHIMINETDPQNSELLREVDRVVCFPAPSPEQQQAAADCQNNPECVPDEDSSTTSTVPPIVAGDIGGATDADDAVEVTSSMADVDAAHD